MNPIMLPVHEYREVQWKGFVDYLAGLIATGCDTDPLVYGARIRWGITEDEVDAAYLDATLQLQQAHDAAA